MMPHIFLTQYASLGKICLLDILTQDEKAAMMQEIIEEKAMQSWPYFRWEYLSVTLSYTGRQVEGQAEFLPRWVNGQELENWQHIPHYTTYLNQLGDEGWELVAISGSNLFFKRPKRWQTSI